MRLDGIWPMRTTNETIRLYKQALAIPTKGKRKALLKESSLRLVNVCSLYYSLCTFLRKFFIEYIFRIDEELFLPLQGNWFGPITSDRARDIRQSHIALDHHVDRNGLG
jgi:hypothetical protein